MGSNNLKNRDNQQGQIEKLKLSVLGAPNWMLTEKLNEIIDHLNKPSEATKEQPKIPDYFIHKVRCVNPTTTLIKNKIYKCWFLKRLSHYYVSTDSFKEARRIIVINEFGRQISCNQERFDPIL